MNDIAPRSAIGWFGRLPAVAFVGVFLVVVIVIFTVSASGFFSLSNVTTIVSAASVLMLAALGQLMVVISGGFDLAIGGVIPLCAVLFALITNAGVPLGVAVLLCLAIGAAVGIVHSFFIVIVKVNPLITTLATLSITGGIAYIVSNGQTISMTAGAGVLGDAAVAGLPWHVFLMIALAIVVHVMLAHTILGRRIYMLGGNPEAARIAGVRTVLVGSAPYVFSGILAGLAGIVLASQLLAASGNIGATITLQSLAAVVLGGAALTGGRGSVIGAVIGVLLLGIIANGMTLLLVPSFYQQVVSGLVLVAAVTLSRLQERSRRSA